MMMHTLTDHTILVPCLPQCPVKRQVIPGYIPEHYVPQLELNMQIFNLDSADFVEYVPASMTWPKPRVFEITTVQRNDAWWAETLPKLELFWQELQHCVSLGPTKAISAATKPVKKAATKTVDVVVIADDLYD